MGEAKWDASEGGHLKAVDLLRGEFWKALEFVRRFDRILNGKHQMVPTTLTIGMATHRDFDGVYFTLNALRLYHAESLPRCEFVIVDNDPDGPQAEHLQGFFSHLSSRSLKWPEPFSVQYVPYRNATGTAAPRDHIFRVAQGNAVLVIDSHINLWPGALKRLLDWYDSNPNSLDLVQGPLVYDDFSTISTHFADVWRDGMWGTWDSDPRGENPNGAPFEIGAQGLGLFSCRKAAWLGFNPHFREFGGEEWYIHEKFRQAGRVCLCLPFLRWVHRFSAPGGGRAYPLTAVGKIRNYILGLQELGLPLDRLRRHFVIGLNEDPNDPVNRDAHLTDDQFSQLVLDPLRYPVQFDACSSTGCQSGGDDSSPCRCDRSCECGDKRQCRHGDLESLFREAVDTASDINEHCDELRRLSSKSKSVVEFGMRPNVSTVALLAGQPDRFLTVAAGRDVILDHLQTIAGKTHFEFKSGTSLEAEIPECDLLFLDTKHTGEHLARELRRHATKARHWIAIHDTDIFGQRGEDGGPGLLPALKDFVKREPSWRVVYHTPVNYGFTVISCDPSDVALNPCPVSGTGNNQTLFVEPFSAGKHLKELKGRHSGEDLYIVGSSASLDCIQPEFFAGRTVIGCNQAFRRFPVTYSVLLEGSEALLREAADCGIVIISRHPFGNTSIVPRQFGIDFPQHYVFSHRMNRYSSIDWDEIGADEIAVSNSVLTSAMHVAAYLGAANVFLYGMEDDRIEEDQNDADDPPDDRTPEQNASEHKEQFHRSWTQEILPQILQLQDRLKAMYGCRFLLVTPFSNFQHVGKQDET